VILLCILLGPACDEDDAAGLPEAGQSEDATADPTPDTGAPDATADVGAEPDAVAVDTWSTFAEGFMTTYCTSCHSEAGIATADYTRYDMVLADQTTIRCGTSDIQLDDCPVREPYTPRFPIGPGPYPDGDERARLVAWFDAGLPE